MALITPPHLPSVPGIHTHKAGSVCLAEAGRAELLETPQSCRPSLSISQLEKLRLEEWTALVPLRAPAGSKVEGTQPRLEPRRS